MGQGEGSAAGARRGGSGVEGGHGDCGGMVRGLAHPDALTEELGAPLLQLGAPSVSASLLAGTGEDAGPLLGMMPTSAAMSEMPASSIVEKKSFTTTLLLGLAILRSPAPRKWVGAGLASPCAS